MGYPHEVDRSEREERKAEKREKHEDAAGHAPQAPQAAQPAPATKGAGTTPAAAAPAAADFITAVTALKDKLAAFKNQPALSGPQIAHGLSAADSQLQMVLTEAHGAQPQVDRITAYLTAAKKSLTDVAGSAPALSSLNASFDELAASAKKTYGGGSVSAGSNKAVAS